MPEGPLGGPRITNLGPFSRSTEEELREKWDTCPESGKEHEICENLKIAAIAMLEGQGFFAECETLEDINAGSCGRVATRVAEEIGGVRVMQIGDADHLWIKYRGKHYDAEVPTGVEKPFDLPFFARIPKDQLLEFSRMAARAEGREPPETIEETMIDVTEEKLSENL